MRSPLLKKLSKRKSGWKPESVTDDDGKIYINRCMISKGSLSKLVEVVGAEEDKVDLLLERKALMLIKELETNDQLFVQRQSLIFSVIAQAGVSQALHFVGNMEQTGKMELNRYINQTEKIVNIIQKDAIKVNGEQMEQMFDNLEDISHKVFQHFSHAIEKGKVVEFLNLIEEFSNAEEVKSEK